MHPQLLLLSDWCRANGVDLTLAHAKMAGAISYAKVKTDKVDAQTLAELLRAVLIPEAYQITPDRRKLRELTRGRLRPVQWRWKLQSTLWGQAIKYNVQIGGSQWRYPRKLEEWLVLQLPPAASLQARLTVGQVSQLYPPDKKRLTSRLRLKPPSSDSWPYQGWEK